MRNLEDDDSFASNLETRLQTWRDAKPPPYLKTQIATSLASRRRFLWRPLLAAGACAAALCVFFAWPGSPVQPAPAFAEVAKSMEAVNSVSYRTEMKTKLSDDGTDEYETGQGWLQRYPPAGIFRSSVRVERGEELRLVRLIDSKGYAELNEKTGKWKLGQNRDNFAAEIQRQFLIFTQPGKESQAANRAIPQSWFKKGGKISPWHSQRTVLNGKPVWLFSSTFHAPERIYKSKWVALFRVSTVRLWADTTSYRLLRSEVHENWEKNGKKEEAMGYRHQVRTEFRYNEPPPPDLRDFRPPKKKAH